jgi:hypothetical protein
MSCISSSDRPSGFEGGAWHLRLQGLPIAFQILFLYRMHIVELLTIGSDVVHKSLLNKEVS